MLVNINTKLFKRREEWDEGSPREKGMPAADVGRGHPPQVRFQSYTGHVSSSQHICQNSSSKRALWR